MSTQAVKPIRECAQLVRTPYAAVVTTDEARRRVARLSSLLRDRVEIEAASRVDDVLDSIDLDGLDAELISMQLDLLADELAEDES